MTTATTLPDPATFPTPPTNLPCEDGIPLESEWHRQAMNMLIEQVSLSLLGREDFYVGGNAFIYFDAKQARDRNFRGPDFFFVWDVPLNPPRPYWAVWDEGGKYPDVIIELSSPSTAEADLGVRKTTYERVFHTPEYFVYDPYEQRLRGWRLHEKLRYQALEPNEKGWLWCEQLALWLGIHACAYQGKQGDFLRFLDRDGKPLPTAQEKSLTAQQHAEAEQRRADAEKQRADAAQRRADAEKQRADAAETELRQLRAQLQKPAN